MDFNKTILENIEELNIKINDINIQRAKFGFINTDCNFIKTMLSSICVHCISNLFIFNNEQIINLNNIINRINYDT